ncbi:MAG: hypothetical protein QGE95_16065, partial [Arenicellales bacterium]|nr:hypothetical protein [Arenicellales bacterium]
PLGLVGFALFLVFSYLAAQPKYAEVRGLRMFFGGLAIIVVLGGLGLAYQKQVGKGDGPNGSERSSQIIKQDTGGSIGSPAGLAPN